MESPRQEYWSGLPFTSPLQSDTFAKICEPTLIHHNLPKFPVFFRVHPCKFYGCKCCSVAQSCPTLCNPVDCSQASLSLCISQSLPKFMSVASVMPSNHLILWCFLLLLPLIFPRIRNFSKKSAVHVRWPRYWSFSFSISPSNEYSGLISLNIDWFVLDCCPRDSQESSPDPQFEGINSSVLHLLIVQLSLPYVTTGKTTALIIWTFASRAVCAF